MQARTIITYLPPKKLKQTKKSSWLGERFAGMRKFVLLFSLIFVYLIYTNQSSTLGYSLRNSLKELERTQDILDDLELEVGQKEQQLWSSVEWQSNKNKIKKITIP